MTRHRIVWITLGIIAVLLAIVGVVLYARNSDTGTYWLNGLLIAPLFLLSMHWLHRVLPPRTQWVLACVLAPLGVIAYVIWPNDQWWNYGALTAVPLIFLIAKREEERGGEASYGGWSDGPWGPP